jgi:hypothetical protein
MTDVYVRRGWPRWLSVLGSLIVLTALAVFVIGVIGTFAGWINVSRNPATRDTVIEVDTGEISDAAKDTVETAAETGRNLAREAGKAIERSTERR